MRLLINTVGLNNNHIWKFGSSGSHLVESACRINDLSRRDINQNM